MMASSADDIPNYLDGTQVPRIDSDTVVIEIPDGVFEDTVPFVVGSHAGSPDGIPVVVDKQPTPLRSPKGKSRRRSSHTEFQNMYKILGDVTASINKLKRKRKRTSRSSSGSSSGSSNSTSDSSESGSSTDTRRGKLRPCQKNKRHRRNAKSKRYKKHLSSVNVGEPEITVDTVNGDLNVGEPEITVDAVNGDLVSLHPEGDALDADALVVPVDDNDLEYALLADGIEYVTSTELPGPKINDTWAAKMNSSLYMINITYQKIVRTFVPQ